MVTNDGGMFGTYHMLIVKYFNHNILLPYPDHNYALYWTSVGYLYVYFDFNFPVKS